MNYRLLTIATLLFASVCFGQKVKKNTAETDSIRDISITLYPYKNAKIYLGAYYGKTKILVDSTFVNEKSEGEFKGKKLTGGIYFVVSPQMSIQFEVLIGENQVFKIIGDSLQKEKPIIKGSADNDLFKKYTDVSVKKGQRISDLSQQLSTTKNTEDSEKIKKEIIQLNKELQDFREDIITKQPTSLLAALLSAMKRPEAPAIPIVNGKPDSSYPYHFVKDHFWDGVDFYDDRLLRTPFYEPKIEEYFKYYVSPEPDSIYKEVKYILLSARTGKEMYPYLLTKFTNKYISPEILGQDKVFVKIFEDFYNAKGDTTLLNASSRKTIIERYYSLIANQLGSPSPNLDLTDTTGKVVSLYSIKSPFVFIAFWDPSCGHCKEEIPRLDSIYKAKWKALGVKVYSVDVKDNSVEEMKGFLNSKNISKDWIITYQEKSIREAEAANNQPNFRQLFDVYKTPTMYLLDEDKRIIAKQLGVLQFDDLIAAKIRQKKNKK